MATIDQYSVATVPIQIFFRKTELSLGTAFVWQDGSDLFLVTNWHNVSGRDPFSGKHLSATASEPDRLRIWWNTKGSLGNKFAEDHPLRETNGFPLWFVHPQYRNQVDVVALPVVAPTQADMYPINQMPSDKLLLQIGMDVFILGYPFGIGHGGLPIWKRGSVASEPEIIDANRPVIFVDSASRPGMSGSPVIRRSWRTHAMEGGGTMMNGGAATKLIGVYSGRLSTVDPNDAQLGLAWPAKFVEEIVSARHRDS